MSKASNKKVNSFFSGIGGFDVAFEKQGFSISMLCEINSFCNQILQRHWPSVKKECDINTIDVDHIPQADVWCGGFPCQDISLARGASKRLGLGGIRSGLFYQFADLISKKSPKVVIIENVGGLFTSNNGRDFGIILQTLSSLRYGVAWRLLNSRYFGVPQSRTRVYLCCWHESPNNALKVMFDENGAEKPSNERKDFISLDGEGNGFPKVPKVSYCLAASSGRHTGTDWSRTYVVCEKGVRRLSPLESERLQGFPDNWTLPDLNSVGDDNIDTLRYTAIGNAVSVPVVEWIAGKIKKVLTSNADDCSIEEQLASYSDFNGKCWSENDLLELDFTDNSTKHNWSRSGLVWKGRYIETDAYPTPARIKRTTLLPLIESEQNRENYYLTPNAAEGILRRVDNQKRTLFAPLRLALEELRALKDK